MAAKLESKCERDCPKPDRTREKPMQIRLMAEEHAAFLKAAGEVGMDLSNWVRMVLRRASRM